jgi:hypothetical protein
MQARVEAFAPYPIQSTDHELLSQPCYYALAGFEAIGATGHAEILRETIAGFGREGPSEGRKTRMDQLSRLYHQEAKPRSTWRELSADL